MTNFSHNLMDEFEVRGHWWLPENPDRKVAGVLNCRAGELCLELLGLLRPESIRERLSSGTEMWCPPLVLGQCEGKQFTLYQLQEVSLTNFGFGVDFDSKLSARFLFVGFHAARPADLRFKEAAFQLTNLEEWLYEGPVFQHGHAAKGPTVEYQRPDSFSHRIEHLDATITSHAGASGLSDHLFEKLTHEASLCVEPSQPQDFDWFLNVVLDCQNLLTFFVGKSVHVKRVELYFGDQDLGGSSVPRHAPVFFRQFEERTDERTMLWEMLLRYPDIKDKVAIVLNHWFRRADDLRAVYELFFGTFYNKKLYLKFQFLSLVQALESFDRSVNPSQYLSDEDYNPIREALVAAIPATTPCSLRSSLKNRVEFGNEYSLRKRLTQILKSLDDKARSLVCSNSATFVAAAVDTRNYFTHYTDELKSEAVLAPEELFHLTQRIRILLTIVLLKDLGIDESLVAAAIRRNPRLSYILDCPEWKPSEKKPDSTPESAGSTVND